MATAKVTINDRVIMDITDTTATAETIRQGYTAYRADGVKVTGTYVPSGGTYQTKTVTPTTSQQTVTADSGYDALSQVIVNAMPTVTHPNPSISVSSSGLITATHTQGTGYVTGGTTTDTEQLTTKARATITPGTTSQTIASGTYLTGTQTIAGDADLVASNIKSGVQIFGVTGSLAFITYYTGTTDPSSSLGQDGDIYLKRSS